MQEALPPRYIARIQYLHRRFQNTQTHYILTHAITQCPINPFMISENKAWLKESWDASALFEGLVERAFEVQ